MARVSQFTRKVFLNRSGNASIAAAHAAGGGNKARGFAQDAARADRNAARAGAEANVLATQRKADSKVRAQAEWNTTKRNLVKSEQEMRLKAQNDPNGFANSFDQFHREQTALVEDEVNLLGEENNFDLDHFRQLADRDRTARFEKSTTFENNQRVKNIIINGEQAIDDMAANLALSNGGWKEFVDYQKEVANYVNEVGGVYLSPQDRVRLAAYGNDKGARDFLFRQLQDDPEGARRVIEYGRGGKDALTDFIMQDIEGGAKVVNEPNGGIAKYGINSIANPNVDVRNLTAEGAAEILKTKYWDDRLEEFDPQFQAIAFDALVNHGPGKSTWEMIDEANGDPYRLIELRQEKYAALVASDPDTYGGSAAGWDNRMNKLTEYVQTLDNGGEDFLQHAALVDSQLLAGARQKLPQALTDKETARKKEIEDANTLDAYTLRQNEFELSKILYDDNFSHAEKIDALRTAEHENKIGSEFANSSESMLLGKKNLKKADYNPEAFPNMLIKKEAFFNKSNDKGHRRVAVSEDMLGEIGDMMVEAQQKGMTGEITPAEAKSMVRSLGLDLAAAEKSIAPGPSLFDWFPKYTHDEKAFRFFSETTDDPAQRNRMFRTYSERSEFLDHATLSGASDKDINQAMQKLADEVLFEHLLDNVPGAARLDKQANNVFTVRGDRIFVGAHSDRPKADSAVTVDRVPVKYKGRDAWQYPDGSLEYME